MSRVWNFSAGPATLPLSVLERVQQDLVDLDGTGIGICEHSHRSPAYDAVHTAAEERVRRLAGAGDDWAVLFLQGGASTQFFHIPMNLGADADYVLTGAWSKKAHAEAAKMGDARVVASSAETTFDHIPKTFDVRADASYLHITSNNTIYGTQWKAWPQTGDVPLVVDMSSDIFSGPLKLDGLSMVYAGAQKNLGPSGLCLVLLRKDLLARCQDTLPTMVDYRTHVEKRSLFNTPPTFAIHVLGLVLAWIEDHGGLEAMAARNAAKATRLYDAIDESPFYEGHAVEGDRSPMNVAFRLARPELDAVFLREAAEAGLANLKGHRSVGGMRASIYNAMEPEGVEALVAFMEEFAQRHAG